MRFIRLHNQLIHYLILFILIYLVIFLKLGSYHLRWWDESIFAVNTYEMIQNGKYFSLFFDNLPDTYNVKPPITSWIQIIFVKLFGYNELSLRLPSAIAASLTVILLFKFITSHFNILYSWITTLILLTSSGFISFHTARTADSDALLTLMLLLTNIYFIKYLISRHNKNILFFFIFITIAFSIKLYAGLLFTPAYLFILFYKRLLKIFILNIYFFLGFFLLIGTIISLIYLRELDTPGYVDTVLFKNQLLTNIDNHNEDALFYIDNLFKFRFSIWATPFLLGCILLFFHKKENEKIILTLLLIKTIFFLLIISSAITKLEWYDMPIYPLLSVLTALPIYIVINTLKLNNLTPNILYAFLAIIFIYPYLIIFNKSQANSMSIGEKKLEANERYLFNNIDDFKKLNGIKVYHKNWKGALLFYKYRLSEKNITIDIINDISKISIDDKVLVSNHSLKLELSNKFNLTPIDSYSTADLVKISSK